MIHFKLQERDTDTDTDTFRPGGHTPANVTADRRLAALDQLNTHLSVLSVAPSNCFKRWMHVLLALLLLSLVLALSYDANGISIKRNLPGPAARLPVNIIKSGHSSRDNNKIVNINARS